MKAPLKGIAALRSFFSGNEENDGDLNPFQLTHKQEDVLKNLRQRITVYVDKKTQVVTLGVSMQDPLISADVAHSIVIKLQTYITHYRTQKAKKDLEFTEKVLKESRSAYYKAQQAYAAFEDGNKNIISASYRTEQERLRNEMTLTFNVYNTLAQKLEQDKLRVQEQTPVYTIIEPATVPLKASSPKKLLILVAFIFLAFIGGCGYLIIKEYAIPPSPRSETVIRKNRNPESGLRFSDYDLLTCNPLSDKLISTKRALSFCGSAVRRRRICKEASGSLATI